jgi:alpha-N-acetylglucosamine transferase
MPLVEPRTYEFYDWSDIEKEFNSQTGKRLRDYAGKYNGKVIDDTIPYRDYWHFILKHYDEIRVGSIVWIDFDWLEEEATEEWQIEVTRKIKAIVGKDQIEVYFWW